MKLLSSLTKKDLKGKRIIVRGDLDVSDLSEKDIRLQRLVPTLKFLIENNSKIILIGHRGRPNGVKDESLSLKPIEKVLQEMLGRSDFEVLENLRFDPRESLDPAQDKGAMEFAKELASKADIYVNEAFSVCHRSHASIVGIPKYLPSYAGLNLENEINNLDKIKNEPERPLVVLISGVKEDKLKMVEPLSKLADKVLVGGKLPDLMGDKGLKSVRNQTGKIIIANLIQDKEDITLNTIEVFTQEILKAKTIVLAGVLGKFEDEGHSQGTRKVFQAVASSKAFKVVGGGDSLAAINKYSLADKFDWVSVGGGAMIEYLVNDNLVGIEALTV